MNITEKRTKVLEYEEVIRTICDKCGAEITYEAYRRNDFELEYSFGYSSPSGGAGERLAVEDLCHNCALELFELLQNMGYVVKRTEWEF